MGFNITIKTLYDYSLKIRLIVLVVLAHYVRPTEQ